MKLRNKKTGKIIKLDIHCIAGKNYESLSEINNEWEDYEEPKEYCYITSRGNFHFIEDIDDEGDKERKEIGNYFETKEEAEKIVEKLKAIKRLKDKGFRITLQEDCEGNWLQANWGNLQGDYSDVISLFGGEE